MVCRSHHVLSAKGLSNGPMDDARELKEGQPQGQHPTPKPQQLNLEPNGCGSALFAKKQNEQIKITDEQNQFATLK
eukprot:3888411-Amphidinium_carterae.1